jgi:uncharacterized repeat protein (TIGR03803 family)
MKIYIFFVLLAITTIAKAQYPVLYYFNGTNGANPGGSLTLSGKELFGVTENGGAYNDGVIFSIDTNGNRYKILHNFNDTNGFQPQGTLALSGRTLFGMTYQGGADSDGVIFSIDTNGSKFKILFSFSEITGKYPTGNSLTVSGNKLFGMVNGGAYNSGVIFSIDTNGNGFHKLLDFNGTTTGFAASGYLSLTGKTLYGMTVAGGANDYGLIFSIDTNGNRYKNILDFNDTNGNSPQGSLTLSGNTLYGMTIYGGTHHDGVIFSIDTNGSGYHKLLDFDGANGRAPGGDLTLSGKTLYGTTINGGANLQGNIFSIDTNGIGYKKIFDFNMTNGAAPDGDITLIGTSMYGMTYEGGGATQYGVIFKYTPLKEDYIISISNSCFGGSNGSANIMITGGNPPYSYIWSPVSVNTSTISGLIAGTYSVTVSDASNNIIIDSVTITQPSSPLLINASTILSACNRNNGSASVNVSGGVQPYTYSWSPSGGNDSTATGLTVGYYTCLITDSLGCSKSQFFNIRDTGTLKTSIISFSNLKCFGDSSGNATISIIGGTKPFTYLWSPSGGNDTIAQNLIAGTYTFSVTDSNGCKADTFVIITQPVKIITIPYCSFPDIGTCTGSAYINVSGGTSPYQYLWSGGLTTDSIINQCHGIYCCTVTDTHGCIDSAACVSIFLDTTLAIAQFINKSENVIIFPNPAVNSITIESSQNAIIEIRNTQGQLMRIISAINNKETIDVSSLSKGVYIIETKTEKGFAVNKFVKE